MAAILSTDETRDFQNFLDSFDQSDAVAASATSITAPSDGLTTMHANGLYHHPHHLQHSLHGNQRIGHEPQAQVVHGYAINHPHPPETDDTSLRSQRVASTRGPQYTYTTTSTGLIHTEPSQTTSPYPNAAPLHTLDDDMLSRMAAQARELSEWMKSRTQAEMAPPVRPPPSYEAPQSLSTSFDLSASAFRSPKRPRDEALPLPNLHSPTSESPFYSSIYQERPPVVARPPGREDPLQAMREAEERAEFTKRMRQANGAIPGTPSVYPNQMASAENASETAPASLGTAESTFPSAEEIAAAKRLALEQAQARQAATKVTTSHASTQRTRRAPATASKRKTAIASHRGPQRMQPVTVATHPGTVDVDSFRQTLGDSEWMDDEADSTNEPGPVKKKATASVATSRPAPVKASATSVKTRIPKTIRSATASAAASGRASPAETKAEIEDDDGEERMGLNPPPFPTPDNIPPTNYKPLSKPRVKAAAKPAQAAADAVAIKKEKDVGKPALLSIEQKKANHIASEQKRRAAIRQGYESLCVVVPALRAAVEEFEERVKRLNGTGGGGTASRSKKRKGLGLQTSAGPLSGGIEIGGEKIDGRAGPKSEAVVLGKTVDHLRQILQDRQDRLERLSLLYQVGQDNGVEITAGRRLWEELWNEDDVAAWRATHCPSQNGGED
ncbi:hypothetical protein OIO90_004552 [Microbotryomycetes sp. JL221]|nr:hypothetical protein OIO90_004552 [Microbotryomycetes sp. JL221]